MLGSHIWNLLDAVKTNSRCDARSNLRPPACRSRQRRHGSSAKCCSRSPSRSGTKNSLKVSTKYEKPATRRLTNCIPGRVEGGRAGVSAYRHDQQRLRGYRIACADMMPNRGGMSAADTLDGGAACRELIFEPLEAAVEVIDAVDGGLTFGRKCGDNERDRGAQVGGHHR